MVSVTAGAKRAAYAVWLGESVVTEFREEKCCRRSNCAAQIAAGGGKSMNTVDGATIAFDSAKARIEEKRTRDFVLARQAHRPRTPRIYVQIPMFIYGYVPGDVPFHEGARTIAIDAKGGLIYMRTAVQPGQRLFVTNEANERTQECAVVFADTRLARGIAVEFEFSIPMPQFWHNMEIGKTIQL
jgi:hypothetical protein